MDDSTKYLKDILYELRKLREEVSNVSRKLDKLDYIYGEVKEFKKMYDKRNWNK